MDKGIIKKEYYIGRYIYLTRELECLPKITFVCLDNVVAVSVKQNGKEHRYTDKNPRWEEYADIARRRQKIRSDIKKLNALWKSEYKGSLKSEAAEYTLNTNSDNMYSSQLWDSFCSNDNSYPCEHPVIYNGIVMRSQLEAEVAHILDELGIDYKYEVRLNLGPQGLVSPDFALNFPEFNRCGFIEVLGAMSNIQYMSKNAQKFEKYSNAGLYINRDIQFITADYGYRPSPDLIKKMIAVICDSFADQYVLRKNAH
jgi:hypothetical protein